MPIKNGYIADADDVNTADGLPLNLFLSDKYGIDYSFYVLYDSTGADYADPSSTADWETGYKVRPGFNYFDRIDDASLDTNKWDVYSSGGGYASVSENGSGLMGGYIKLWAGNDGSGIAYITSKTGGLFNDSNRVDTYVTLYDVVSCNSSIQITDGTNTVDLVTYPLDINASYYYTFLYDPSSDTVTVYRNYDWDNPVASNVDVSSVTGTREIRYYLHALGGGSYGTFKIYWLSTLKKTVSELYTSTLTSDSIKGFYLTSQQEDEDSTHTIDWYYSIDGGTNWNAFIPRSMVWFDSEQSALKFKVVFTCPANDLKMGPRVSKYAVAWLR